MTRTYTLKRLLEHGPLTIRQSVEITGWTCKQVHSALDSLLSAGLIVMRRGVRARWNAYQIAD